MAIDYDIIYDYNECDEALKNHKTLVTGKSFDIWFAVNNYDEAKELIKEFEKEDKSNDAYDQDEYYIIGE